MARGARSTQAQRLMAIKRSVVTLVRRIRAGTVFIYGHIFIDGQTICNDANCFK